MRSGSPFYHFQSKQALLYAVMEEGMRAAIAQQARVPQKAEQPALTPRGLPAVLGANHVDFLRGPRSARIHVLPAEPRPATPRHRATQADLPSSSESPQGRGAAAACCCGGWS